MSALHDHDSRRIENPALLIGLVFSILLGAFVRFVHVLPLDYPLNDGGFFFQLIQDLQSSSALLPSFTSYNQSEIPYAYPPLAFCLTNLLYQNLGVSLIDLIRILPPLLSCLTIPAFYWLSRKMLSTPIQVIAGTIAFSMLPTAFDWLIVGAGLTRSLGIIFAILTLVQLQSLNTSGRKRHIVLATIFASLTILSHPGTAWFAFYSGGVLFLYNLRWGSLFKSNSNLKVPWKRVRHSLANSSFVVTGTAILTSPWWGTLVQRHGLETLLYPYQTESFSITALVAPFSLLFTNEPLVDILVVIGFLGFLVSLRERKFTLPLWLVAIFFFEPRLSAVYAALPMALFVGIGIDKAILPLVESSGTKTRLQGMLPKLSLGFLMLYVLISAYLAPQYQSLSPAQVNSMEWVDEHTSHDSQFILFTGHESYGDDYTSEWFPALSHRHNLTTPQGHEWLPDKEFSRRVSLHAELQTFASTDIDDLETWAKHHQLTFSHIFVAKKALREQGVQFSLLRESIEKSFSYKMVFENEDTLIFKMMP